MRSDILVKKKKKYKNISTTNLVAHILHSTFFCFRNFVSKPINFFFQTFKPKNTYV